MSQVLAIIPARGGSKGVPKKNIRPLADIPLIAYSIAACQKSNLVDRIIVSTDSPEIAEIAQSYGADVPFLRPEAAAGDSATDYLVMDHLLQWMHAQREPLPELLVHIRPTTPLRDPVLIDAAITQMRALPSATAMRSVHEMGESAYKCFEIESGLLRTLADKSFELDIANNARQKFPPTYTPNGYVDLLKPPFIVEYQKIHGNRVSAFITPSVVEVDTLDDFAYLEYCIQTTQRNVFTTLFGE